MPKIIILSLFILFFFACKKTTSYQVVVYNDSSEQLKVKVYSHLTLKTDSFIVNSLSQHEVFFKEEDGTNFTYDCTTTLDSLFTYSATNKMKVKVGKASLWEYFPNAGSYKEEHRCTLYIGKGDTIK